MFDAELAGAVLNMHWLGRLVRWLKPYRFRIILSTVLVLVASYAAVVMEILISRVLVDYIIVGETESPMPDMGMIELTIWLSGKPASARLTLPGSCFSLLWCFLRLRVTGIVLL